MPWLADPGALAGAVDTLVVAMPLDATCAFLCGFPRARSGPRLILDVASLKEPVVRAAAGIRGFRRDASDRGLRGERPGCRLRRPVRRARLGDRSRVTMPRHSTAARAFVERLGSRALLDRCRRARPDRRVHLPCPATARRRARRRAAGAARRSRPPLALRERDSLDDPARRLFVGDVGAAPGGGVAAGRAGSPAPSRHTFGRRTSRSTAVNWTASASGSMPRPPRSLLSARTTASP